MESSNHPIERKDFEALIHAIGFEIEHAQVKLIVAANAQMLFHYWKLGNFILFQRLSRCTIPKRKDIQREALPICVSLPEHTH